MAHHLITSANHSGACIAFPVYFDNTAWCEHFWISMMLGSKWHRTHPMVRGKSIIQHCCYFHLRRPAVATHSIWHGIYLFNQGLDLR